MAVRGKNSKEMTEVEIRLKNEQTYDSTLAAMVTKLQEYVAPLINEMFNENYSDQVQVTIRNNKRILFVHDGSFRRRETDAFIELKEQVDILTQKLYHFECETWFDDTIVIRVAEYGSSIALETAVRTSNGIILNYPNSSVIVLRPGADIPAKFTITHRGPNGAEMSYEVPVVQVSAYSIEDLFEKRLLILVPFYLFRYVNELEKIESDKEKKDRLIAEIVDINERLEELLREKKIDTYQKMTTQELLKRVSDRLTLQYKDVRKGVDQVMSGYIARTVADDILEKGEKKGEEKGEKRGEKKGEKKGSASATRLMNYLWRNNRGEDAMKAEEDRDYYLKLLQEYNETHSAPVLAEDADTALSEEFE